MVSGKAMLSYMREMAAKRGEMSESPIKQSKKQKANQKKSQACEVSEVGNLQKTSRAIKSRKGSEARVIREVKSITPQVNCSKLFYKREKASEGSIRSRFSKKLTKPTEEGDL